MSKPVWVVVVVVLFCSIYSCSSKPDVTYQVNDEQITITAGNHTLIAEGAYNEDESWGYLSQNKLFPGIASGNTYEEGSVYGRSTWGFFPL